MKMKEKANKKAETPNAERRTPNAEGDSLKAGHRAKPDEFRMIKRAELFPDPEQPRKTFGSLVTLARSIREQGIIQPLIVRFVPAKYKLREPDLHSKDWHVEERLEEKGTGGEDAARTGRRDACPTWAHAFQGTEEACRSFAGELNLSDRYVIVAGERRWRASAPREFARTDTDGHGRKPTPIRWEGLEELPCVVRDVDARRKFAQQWIENNQREGVSAIEEAEALLKEFERRKAEIGGSSFAKSATEDRGAGVPFTAESFARENGMSRADFYGTLVLTRLHKPVREALVSGKISPSLAKVVAMVPEPKQQEKLLAQLTDEEVWQYPYSVRDAQDLVDDEYVKNLNEAPFKKGDVFEFGKEYPESVRAKGILGDSPSPRPSPAGRGGMVGQGNSEVTTCELCPHRSGNMADQFPELAKRPNVCTNVHCFSLKCKAHWLAAGAAATAAGKKVMTETEFRKVKGQYVKSTDRTNAEQAWYKDWDDIIGKKKPEAAFVATKDGLVTVYPKDEAVAAAKANGYKFSSTVNRTPEEKKAAEEKAKQEEQRGLRRESLVMGLVPELETAIGKLNQKEGWELAALLLEHQSNFDRDLVKRFEDKKDARTRALGKLFGRNWPLNWQKKWDDTGVQAWKMAGIDLEERFEAAEKGQQKALALPAGKKEAKQGELLTVKKGKGPKGPKGRKG